MAQCHLPTYPADFFEKQARKVASTERPEPPVSFVTRVCRSPLSAYRFHRQSAFYGRDITGALECVCRQYAEPVNVIEPRTFWMLLQSLVLGDVAHHFLASPAAIMRSSLSGSSVAQ